MLNTSSLILQKIIQLNRVVMRKTFFILVMLFSSLEAMSCDCAFRKSVKETFLSTEFVLEVIVIRSNRKHQLDQSRSFLDSLGKKHRRVYFKPATVNQYVLAVSQVFKGQVLTDTIVLRTNLSPVYDCGLLLEEGKTYILYASEVSKGTHFSDSYKDTQVLSSSVCSRTTEYSKLKVWKVKRAKRKANRGTSNRG